MEKRKIDYFDLAKIYIGILSEKQHEQLFKRFTHTKSTFIPGTMTFGEHFYYTNESFLEEYMFDKLRYLDHRDLEIYPKIIVFLARIILNNEGAEYEEIKSTK